MDTDRFLRAEIASRILAEIIHDDSPLDKNIAFAVRCADDLLSELNKEPRPQPRPSPAPPPTEDFLLSSLLLYELQLAAEWNSTNDPLGFREKHQVPSNMSVTSWLSERFTNLCKDHNL